MSPQNHQKGNLMFTLPKSDILHFNQSQVQNRHKVHRTKRANDFPTCVKEAKHMGNTSQGIQINMANPKGDVPGNLGFERKRLKGLRLVSPS